MTCKPNLTKADWVEIYYSLTRKQESVLVQGNERWRKHIARIINKIGPDGQNMHATAR